MNDISDDQFFMGFEQISKQDDSILNQTEEPSRTEEP